MHLQTASPILVKELERHFDTCALDLRGLSAVITKLASKPVAGVVTRLEYYEFFSILGSMLEATGTTFGHCLTWEHGPSALSQDDLAQIGLCACIDVSQDVFHVADQVREICESCEHHPSSLLLDSTSFGGGSVDANGIVLPGADDRMADLVAHGFSDREISEILHFPNQTIRNRISRILRENGFNNRTELGNARLRHSIQTYLDQKPQTPDGTDH